MSTTDPQQELLAEVDKENNVIGSIPRGEAHKSPDKIYRTIAVFVSRDDGKYLWQKRSETKDLYPGCWDFSVGGHVNYGQSYIDTAVRELKEELGLDVNDTELDFKGEILVNLPQSNEFFHVFSYKLKEEDNLKYEEEEISDTQWLTLEEVKQSIESRNVKWYPRPIQILNGLFFNKE